MPVALLDVSVTLPPAQNVVGPPGVIVGVAGTGLTVTVVADGKTTIRTVSGDVEVGIIEGADVYLDLSSTSGDVTCELEPSSGPTADEDLRLVLDATSVSGDVRVLKVSGLRAG